MGGNFRWSHRQTAPVLYHTVSGSTVQVTVPVISNLARRSPGKAVWRYLVPQVALFTPPLCAAMADSGSDSDSTAFSDGEYERYGLRPPSELRREWQAASDRTLREVANFEHYEDEQASLDVKWKAIAKQKTELRTRRYAKEKREREALERQALRSPPLADDSDVSTVPPEPESASEDEKEAATARREEIEISSDSDDSRLGEPVARTLLPSEVQLNDMVEILPVESKVHVVDSGAEAHVARERTPHNPLSDLDSVCIGDERVANEREEAVYRDLEHKCVSLFNSILTG